MKKKVFLTLICLTTVCLTTLLAAANHKQDDIEAHKLTGNWIFEKAEILQKLPNAQAYIVKETIDRLPDLYAFSFCFHHTPVNLVFMSENRLSFEPLNDPPQTDAAYRLIPQDNGETLLEIFIQREGEDVPIPTGFDYRISLQGADRLAITAGTACLPGEEMIVSYLKRTR